MQNRNYTATIEVAKSAKEVFNSITNVTKWWSRDFEGSSTKLDANLSLTTPGSIFQNRN
jgi:hypothetical protein